MNVVEKLLRGVFQFYSSQKLFSEIMLYIRYEQDLLVTASARIADIQSF